MSTGLSEKHIRGGWVLRRNNVVSAVEAMRILNEEKSRRSAPFDFHRPSRAEKDFTIRECNRVNILRSERDEREKLIKVWKGAEEAFHFWRRAEEALQSNSFSDID